MASPNDPKERAKDVPFVTYHYADSDDEDEDTRETRRSIKTAEKMLKKRFFINARDRKDYEQMALAGKISAEELAFAEDEDQKIGSTPAKLAALQAKEAAKKAKLQKAAQDALAKFNKAKK